MSLQIKVMRGLFINMPAPTAETVGEFRYCIDTKELYIVSPTDNGYENKLIGLAPDTVERVIYLDAETPLTGVNIINAIGETRYADNVTYILVTETEGRGFITLSEDVISGTMIQFTNSPKYYYFSTLKISEEPILKQEIFINSVINPVTLEKPIPYYTEDGLTGKEFIIENITKENQDPESELFKGNEVPAVSAVGTGSLKAYKKKDTEHLTPIIDFNANEKEDHEIELAFEADDVDYENESHIDVTNVNEALDKLFAKVYYEKIAIKTFNVPNANNYDKGRKIEGPFNITWSYNKNPISQSLKVGSTTLPIILTDRAYTYSPATPINTDTSFVLCASDEENEVSSTKSFAFLSRRYWGVTTTKTIDEAGIKALSNELCTSRNKDLLFNCTGGRYIWYVIPTRYASGMKWEQNGQTFSAYSTYTTDITNAYGYTENFTVCSVDDIQTGDAVPFKVL